VILYYGTLVENTAKYIARVINRVWRTIYYSYSRLLKELRARIKASQKFYQQLIGYKFTLITDHIPLKKMLETTCL
jgi:hypothetical protein